MAAAKKQSNRRGTAKTASGRKNTRKKQTRKQVKKQGVTSGFQTEIILLTILAASIILIISNLGMGGVVGAAISKASFDYGIACVCFSGIDLCWCCISCIEQ